VRLYWRCAQYFSSHIVIIRFEFPRLRHQRYRLCRRNSAITRFEPPPASVIYAPPLQQRHRTF
jgi:hypothetical protein